MDGPLTLRRDACGLCIGYNMILACFAENCEATRPE